MGPRSLAAVALALAATTLGGCDLVTPGAPAGALPLVISVQNDSPFPARLEVRAPVAGAKRLGIAQPDTAPPDSTIRVRFLLPPAQDWAIWVNGRELIDASDLRGRFGTRDDIGISVGSRGEPSWWCTRDCP